MIPQDWLCLDLLKTRGWEARDRDDDLLDEPERFLEWLLREEVIGAAELRRLVEPAEGGSAGIQDLIDRLRELRLLLHRMFSRIADGRIPESGDLATLETALEASGERLALTPDPERGLTWTWRPRRADGRTAGDDGGAATGRRIVGTFARSAADLLTCGELERIKVCDANDCGWFFVDVSRNRSRRWCDMAGCGNRDKARRYRERHS